MAAVQFYGKEQVIESAANMGGTAWAIFSGTSLITKWESKDPTESAQALEQWLDMLMQSGTAAVYKIKFFEVPEGSEKIKINEKTVCDAGSFSFKLQEPHEGIVQYGIRGVAMTETNVKLDKLLQIVEAQQKRLEELESIEPENDDEETIGSVLLDAVKNPDKLMGLVNTIKAITGIGMNNAQPNYAAIGNVQPSVQTNTTMPAEPGTPEYNARVQRMCAAVDILEKADPLFVEHLEKLADMALNNKAKYNLAISLL